ncbi:hypothetical protein OIU84_027949 [Salix udensis]|uniref:SPARK domain-containing protein n=1 Tax=Salix udensis TaxID=889485 RepID=A0AAD6P8E5_9ROSI|nr:hypothetical protein OIU84_027949 [Salix udensis]
MEGFQIFSCLKGSLGHQFLLFIVWSSSFQVAVALQTPLEPNHVSSTSELATPPVSGLFGPIEISPSVLPRYPYPGENLAPMYPTFPTTYEPNLTGKCPVNFTAMSNVIDRTASDCSQPLAALVGNVICCPQLGSLLHIFQGYFSGNSDKLVLQNAVADDCFSDIISILASRGANITIPALCSVKSLNLTGGLCPVKDVVNFEKIVNTSKLLEACSTVDPLKECCRPICQSAIMEAALEISGTQLTINDYKDSVTVPNHNDPLSDCKGVVFSYISRKLSADAASSAFRIVSACKVNKGTNSVASRPLALWFPAFTSVLKSSLRRSNIKRLQRFKGFYKKRLITYQWNKGKLLCKYLSMESREPSPCFAIAFPDCLADSCRNFLFNSSRALTHSAAKRHRIKMFPVIFSNIEVHIAGVGDYNLAGATALADPCPLPSAAKKKGLRDKEKLFYAPMSGIGDLVYDKDAVYININDHFVQYSNVDNKNESMAHKGKDQDVGESLVKSLQNTKYSIDEKLEKSFISLFSRNANISSEAQNDAKDNHESVDHSHNLEPNESVMALMKSMVLQPSRKLILKTA